MGEAVEKVEAAEDGWNIFLDLSRWLPWGHKEAIHKSSDYKVATTEELKEDVDLDANVKQRTEELKNKLLIRRLSDYRQKLSQLGGSKDDFSPSEKDADSVQDQNKMVSAGLDSSDGNSLEIKSLDVTSGRDQDLDLKSVVEIHQAEDTRSSEKEPEADMRKADLRATRVGMKIQRLKEYEKEMRAAESDKNEAGMNSSALEKPEIGMRSASQKKPEARMRNVALEEPEAGTRTDAPEEPDAGMRNAALEEPEAGMRNVSLEEPEAGMRTVALNEQELGMRKITLENQEASVEQAALEKQESGMKTGRAVSLDEWKAWSEGQRKAEMIRAVTREQKLELQRRRTALKELKEGTGSSALEGQDKGIRNESREKLQPVMRRRRRGEKALHRLIKENAAISKQAFNHLRKDFNELQEGWGDPANQSSFYEHP
jgi:hypothetical protein